MSWDYWNESLELYRTEIWCRGHRWRCNGAHSTIHCLAEVLTRWSSDSWQHAKCKKSIILASVGPTANLSPFLDSSFRVQFNYIRFLTIFHVQMLRAHMCIEHKMLLKGSPIHDPNTDFETCIQDCSCSPGYVCQRVFLYIYIYNAQIALSIYILASNSVAQR